MPQRLGGVSVEVTGAESPKFTAPLLLIHGLWSTAEVWRRWSGFLAHRGWTCHAISLQEARDSPPPGHWTDYERRIGNAIAALGTLPIVVGHDLGGMLAMRLARRTQAVVALAPYLPRSLRGVTDADLVSPSPLSFWWRRVAMPPPRGKRGRLLCGDPQLPRISEPRGVIRSLLQDEPVIEALDKPTLIMIGDRDPFLSRGALEGAAHHLHASLLIAENAGHALAVEAGWEQRVSVVHRWLIKTLGDPLLALREESEAE